MQAPVITLLTDFGLSDPYVAQMKGVILGLSPRAVILDISHDVTPQDVEEAALLLADSFRFFPRHTVHVAVVDPGVGGSRKPIAVQTENHYFVGPDNGIFTAALEGQTIVAQVELSRPDYFLPHVSATFHGRDIFAPVAAHISIGVGLDWVGTPLKTLVQLALPQPFLEKDSIRLQVLRVDRFGSLITNLTQEAFRKWLGRRRKKDIVLEVGDSIIHGIQEYYSQVPPGQPLALWGSSGRLEIAVREGNAAEVPEVGKGAALLLKAVR